MTIILGCDEAGRGPVIGPLVMCGVIIEEGDEQKLLSLGAKDSKLLTPRTREILFEQIKRMVKDYKIIIVPVEEVDGVLAFDGLNLNKLEAMKMAQIINELKPDKVILDCPSPNPKEYTFYLRKHLMDKDMKIVAEHKADVNYPVVSAASILAKVTRDREIEKIKEKIGIDFGSGYTSDERTQKFMKEHWVDHHSIFRKNWMPYKKLVNGKNQKKIDEFYEHDN